MESRETSADFHNAILEFNCYLMSIENGLLHSHTSFVLFFSKWKSKFMLSSCANVIDKIMVLDATVMSNIFETPPTIFFGVYLCVKPFCIWSDLISDFFWLHTIEMTSHIHSFNIWTYTPNFNPQQKSNFVPIQFTHFTPSVLIFFHTLSLLLLLFGCIWCAVEKTRLLFGSIVCI